MKRTTSEEPLRLPSVNISHSSFISSHYGDSHTYYGNAYYGNTYYGNVYNEISTHAGNQFKSYCSRIFAASSRIIGFPWPTILDRVAMSAAYDSQERDTAPRCLPGTRMAVLEEIETWIEAGGDGGSVFWLHGPAGAGKSAIAQTVAETCAERDELAASFFFARTVASQNSAKHLFPTIAVQIALSAPEKRERLDSILRNDPWINERALGSVDLVASLFQQGSVLLPSSQFLVVIDGLDECQRRDDQCRILAQISHMINTHRLPLRFLIVSRPEAHICEAFEEPGLENITKSLSLYGDFQARDDVSMYLRSEFSRIYESRKHRDVMEFVPRPWPSKDVIATLVDKSGGYFIYASTVIKFIDEESFSPTDRLDEVLNGSNSAVAHSDSAPFAELDKLYIQILSSYPTSKLPTLKRILGYVEFAASDWEGEVFRTIAEVEALLNIPHGQVKLSLRGLRSLVSLEEWEGGIVDIHLNHASFGDFLHDKERSGDYYLDFEKWLYTAFCDALTVGCKILDFPPHAGVKPASRYSEGLSITIFPDDSRIDQCTSRL